MKRMQRVFNDFDALRYVDGGLDAERKAAYLAHLADHPDETERLAIWAKQTDTLRALYAAVTAEPVPPALRLARVLPRVPDGAAPPRAAIPLRPALVHQGAGLPDQAADPGAGLRPRSRRWPLSVAILLGAALLVASAGQMVIGTATHWGSAAAPPAVQTVEPPRMTLADRATDAFTTYALDAVRPVEFSATQTGLLTHWARRRLGLAIEAPDFTPEGWTLLGGRYVPVAETPGVLFIYEDRAGDRLALLAGRATSSRLPPVLQARPAGLSTMTWSDGTLAYAITAGRSVDWLARNGEALRARVPRPARD